MVEAKLFAARNAAARSRYMFEDVGELDLLVGQVAICFEDCNERYAKPILYEAVPWSR